MLFPFYVEDYLMATADWYGYILAGLGLGAMIGYALASAIQLSGRARSNIIVMSLIACSLTWMTFGFIANKILAIILMLTTGAFSGFISVNIITLLQQTTPSWIRGRVFALLTTISTGLTPLGMGLAGVIFDLLNHNIQLIVIASGLASVIIYIILAFSREFRVYMAYEIT